jgi:hypothetical protein
MTYNYNFIVKKTGPTEWTVYTDKGVTMHVLTRCSSKSDAETQVKAWASTCHSVSIRVIDEQDKP